MEFTWTALSPLVLGDPDIIIVNMYGGDTLWAHKEAFVVNVEATSSISV